MARAQRIICDSCMTTRIDPSAPFCRGCGRPTLSATHQDRVDWEVQQWRKGRAVVGGEGTKAVMNLPVKSRQRPADPSDNWDGFLSPADPKPRAARRRREGSSPVARLKRVLAGLRKLFATPMMVPLGSKPATMESLPAPIESKPAPFDEPSATAADPAPSRTEPPRMVLVRPAPAEVVAEPAEPNGTREPIELETKKTETPAPAAPAPRPAPVAIVPVSAPNGSPSPRKAPAKPRRRSNPPTNKDMLKQTLSVLTKVEQRLGQLEQEVAGIDDAVRKVAPVQKRATKTQRAGKQRRPGGGRASALDPS